MIILQSKSQEVDLNTLYVLTNPLSSKDITQTRANQQYCKYILETLSYNARTKLMPFNIISSTQMHKCIPVLRSCGNMTILVHLIYVSQFVFHLPLVSLKVNACRYCIIILVKKKYNGNKHLNDLSNVLSWMQFKKYTAYNGVCFFSLFL